jgi:hypothetical protein
MTVFRTQYRDRDLAPHPHRVELRGNPRRLTWPPYCPNCGAAARDRITVRKVFARGVGRRRGGGPRYRIEGVPIPFCSTCVGLHERTAVRQTPLRRALTYLQSFLIIPVIGALTMAFLLSDAALLSDAVRAARLDDPANWLGVGVVGLFVLIAVVSLLAMWRDTRRYRVPPQTEVTLACDFSDDISGAFEGERRVYAIRDAGFAEELAAANRDRAWTGAMQARSRHRQLVVATVGVALAVGWWLWTSLGLQLPRW